MNETLPVFQFKSEIVQAIKDNSVTIITAETGAGKSTQVPQYLLDAGYDLVVTQPRRLAARTVAQRVAEEYGCEFGSVVGFRTAHEGIHSNQTRCLFVTDGLALVRELMGLGKKSILVLDEVHEWNLNIEVLIAWAKRQIESGADFKLVIMSATLEADKLAAFYDNPPIIRVPGRLFPVKEERADYSMIDDIIKLLKHGRNVLVFQPGKSEISDTISRLKEMDLNSEILPLHGELSPEEQAKCFKHYGRPKCIVSTNIAQTSVTIDDIDAVVDSGTERRVELVDGVEGLYIKPISYADAEQRKGRAGRTKSGVYIDHCRSADRLDFPKAEILRVRLDQTVLRLAEAGINAEELAFFHQPDKAEIHEAKRALKALGCMNDQGAVTSIGHRVAKLPISVKFGRMVIEAENLGVVDDVIDVAALLEQGEITIRKSKEGVLGKYVWGRKICPNEGESDIMAQLAVFRAAENMTKEAMIENGIFIKAFFEAKEKRKHLADALRGKVKTFHSTGKREDILRAICAGMVDHLYQSRYGSCINGDGQYRRLSEGSVVNGYSTEWLVGIPFDLEIKTKYGNKTLNLVTMATKVEPAWLMEVAPQLVQIKEDADSYFDPVADSYISINRNYFNGHVIEEKKVVAPEHKKAAEVFADWLASEIASDDFRSEGILERFNEALLTVVNINREIQRQTRDLNIRAGAGIFPIASQDAWKQWLMPRLEGARRIAEVDDVAALLLPELDQALVNKIFTENPNTTEAAGQYFAVLYREGYSPQISIDVAVLGKINTPSIKLPGGQLVEVKATSFAGGWRMVSHTGISIPILKEKMRSYLNESAWEELSKSEMIIPDLSIEGTVIPEVVEREYGKCQETGVPLLAYGTVVARRDWQTSQITWEYQWCRERDTAETHRDDAMKMLPLYQAEERKKRALAAIPLPDLHQEDVEIPEIVEIEGGYGVVVVNLNRPHSWDPHFEVCWERHRYTADAQRKEAVKKLVALKAAIRDLKLRQSAPKKKGARPEDVLNTGQSAMELALERANLLRS